MWWRKRTRAEANVPDVDWETELHQPARHTPDIIMNHCDADHAERAQITWDHLVGTLKFCDHHSRQNATTLTAQGWHVISPRL